MTNEPMTNDQLNPNAQCPMFFFSSRRRHTRLQGDWSSDVCSSDLRDYKVTGVQTCALPIFDSAGAILSSAEYCGVDVRTKPSPSPRAATRQISKITRPRQSSLIKS